MRRETKSKKRTMCPGPKGWKTCTRAATWGEGEQDRAVLIYRALLSTCDYLQLWVSGGTGVALRHSRIVSACELCGKRGGCVRVRARLGAEMPLGHHDHLTRARHSVKAWLRQHCAAPRSITLLCCIFVLFVSWWQCDLRAKT
ncbi:hypothetical protein BCV69DRAFT_91240 [Microstroma glucosiphilum]|uniref:Uncharacterized protein n=1 Tax=Pseudomicrostroma glucosiphilum TaxID=1684307 RepID=A0A316TZB4_9BASI|nr:hypothetical protein BCV69DRAFT_91240 [Pseudomicrostroma glucosiphilum]PWN18014.1 hypothetical protein BCV69DRAFT_91240 [Pseudomicrostroma glucosiphilum]